MKKNFLIFTFSIFLTGGIFSKNHYRKNIPDNFSVDYNSNEVYLLQACGKVVDCHGDPLVGVHVVIKNSNPVIGTVTDSEGNYCISPINSGDILEFTFIGFETTTVEITNAPKCDPPGSLCKIRINALLECPPNS